MVLPDLSLSVKPKYAMSGLPAGLKEIVKAYEDRFNVCVRIGDAVSYASLGRKVHHAVG